VNNADMWHDIARGRALRMPPAVFFVRRIWQIHQD